MSLTTLSRNQLLETIKSLAGDHGNISEYLHDICPEEHDGLVSWFSSMSKDELVTMIKLIASECADGGEKVEMYTGHYFAE